MKLIFFGSCWFTSLVNPHIWLHMAQQWRDVLATQIVEHMDEDEDEDWFINMMVQENVSIPIAKHEHPIHGGFRLGRSPNLLRLRQLGHDRIYVDYFSENLVYDGRLFRRQYKMNKTLFLLIMDTLVAHDVYFFYRQDVLGVHGLSNIQKCITTLNMFAYRLVVNAIDEYCTLGETTTMESLKCFVAWVWACFESTYLRQPTRANLVK